MSFFFFIHWNWLRSNIVWVLVLCSTKSHRFVMIRGWVNNDRIWTLSMEKSHGKTFKINCDLKALDNWKEFRHWSLVDLDSSAPQYLAHLPKSLLFSLTQDCCVKVSINRKTEIAMTFQSCQIKLQLCQFSFPFRGIHATTFVLNAYGNPCDNCSAVWGHAWLNK